MSTKPTRGPWTIEATDTAGESIYVTNAKPLDDPACVTVARVATMPDARLIAAAPDLAAALRTLVEAVQFTPLGIPAIKACETARAVLAKLDH